MKTNNQLKMICLVVALSGNAGILLAQENQKSDKSSVNREMTLEREYNPTVQDANKVNTLPVIHEPNVTKRAIDYASFTLPTEPAKEISLLPSGSIMTQIEANKRRGYVNLGAGNYMNINGDFGYHILDNEADRLSIYFTHRSTNGNVKYIQNDEKVKQKINDNLGGLDFKHKFELATLKLGANYGYSAFNYFGYPFFVYDQDKDLSTFEKVFDRQTNQGNQTLGINAAVESNEGAPLGYLIGIDYANFTQKYGYSTQYDGVKENKITTRLGMNAPFGGNQLIGVSAKFDYFNFGDSKDPSNNTFKLGENRLEGTLTPYYKVEGDNWNLRLGANAMFITGDNKKVFFSPNISLDVKATEQTVFYLKADGKIQSNTSFELSKMNRYADPYGTATPSRTWLDGLVGLHSNVGSGFWFDVFAGYKATDDALFFIPTVVQFGNVASTIQRNATAIKAGASFKYNYSQMVSFYLKGTYTKWDVKGNYTYYNPLSSTYPLQELVFSDLKAYGQPDFELSAGLRLTPIEPLTFDLNYYMGSGRYTLLTHPFDLEGTTYMLPENTKLDNIHDVNVTGTWKFNETFSIYAKINNLLFQKYDLNYGYPSQGLNGMVGFNVNF